MTTRQGCSVEDHLYSICRYYKDMFGPEERFQKLLAAR